MAVMCNISNVSYHFIIFQSTFSGWVLCKCNTQQRQPNTLELLHSWRQCCTVLQSNQNYSFILLSDMSQKWGQSTALSGKADIIYQEHNSYHQDLGFTGTLSFHTILFYIHCLLTKCIVGIHAKSFVFLPFNVFKTALLINHLVSFLFHALLFHYTHNTHITATKYGVELHETEPCLATVFDRHSVRLLAL